MEHTLNKTGRQLITEFDHELQSILRFWSTVAVDEVNSGFFGKIDNSNTVDAGAVKGAVLNARILWTYAAAYNYNARQQDLEMAHRSYNYIIQYFIDNQYGGVYWSVTATGAPADTKKQIYALAFVIYALAEYYRAVPNLQVLQLAQSLYQDIEKHSFDPKHGGYLEALTRDWQSVDDLRLSDKDANEKKTMNTHLHVLEAYTNLYRVWPDEGLKQQIIGLIANFTEHIIDTETGHLGLFFDEEWNSRSKAISYGHDIEASWLLLEAAEVLHDSALIAEVEKISARMALASVRGLDSSGALNYEYDAAHGHAINQKHWWVQAEAMVGFLNAWQITGDRSYFDHFASVWHYTKQNIINQQHGEWYWGRNEDGSLMPGEDKAGFWKCPYHNGRACLEVIKRLGA